MKAFLVGSLLAGVLALSVQPIHSRPFEARPQPLTAMPEAPVLPDGAEELAPIAAVKFCMDYPEQCQNKNGTGELTLSHEAWQTLHRVNWEVNRRIRPDAAKGAFMWSLEADHGNCNDYAVQKRRALLDAGFPSGALSLTVAITRSGIGHLLLIVRTDRGDIVLDNLRNAILPWNRTGYRLVKRQSPDNATRWVAIHAERASTMVARLERRHIAPVGAPLNIVPAPRGDEPVSETSTLPAATLRLSTFSGDASVSRLPSVNVAEVDVSYSPKIGH